MTETYSEPDKFNMPDTIIGIDFDNTIINYNDIMYKIATSQKLIDPSTAANKKNIRDKIRLLPNGESKWRELQTTIYSNKIELAIPANGVRNFFKKAHQFGIKLYVISHKTQFPNYGKLKIDLRKAALKWLDKHQFFDEKELGFTRNNVFFETTREQKIDKVGKLKCTHFIDDLIETFIEPNFPLNTIKILYSSNNYEYSDTNIKVAQNWNKIDDIFFG